MIHQSIRVGDAALRCPWYLCGANFRRSLSIMLANTVEPLKLTGGKFFILDYAKLLAVRKFGWPLTIAINIREIIVLFRL